MACGLELCRHMRKNKVEHCKPLPLSIGVCRIIEGLIVHDDQSCSLGTCVRLRSFMLAISLDTKFAGK